MGAAEDRDPIGQHSAVAEPTFGQRYPDVQSEQRLALGRLVLDQDDAVVDQRDQGVRDRIDRLVDTTIEVGLIQLHGHGASLEGPP